MGGSPRVRESSRGDLPWRGSRRPRRHSTCARKRHAVIARRTVVDSARGGWRARATAAPSGDGRARGEARRARGCGRRLRARPHATAPRGAHDVAAVAAPAGDRDVRGREGLLLTMCPSGIAYGSLVIAICLQTELFEVEGLVTVGDGSPALVSRVFPSPRIAASNTLTWVGGKSDNRDVKASS